MPRPTIRAVRTFLTQPGPAGLLVVRVETDEPELFGLGDATFTYRLDAVRTVIDQHLAPLVVGRDPSAIEDLWQVMTHHAYWRHGPVLNNAIAGIDMALWDIKGKAAGVPCHQLWGGACRPAAPAYACCVGRDPDHLIDLIRQRRDEGFGHLRCQLGDMRGLGADDIIPPPGAAPGRYFDPAFRLRTLPAMFERIRAEFGDGIELIHDVHERLKPADAAWLAAAVAPYRLFFLEDPLAPEDAAWLRRIRETSTTPLAFGELLTDARAFVPLIRDGLIDFVRAHLSMIGGITPALKLARLAEMFGVGLAWHAPGDQSPIGPTACVQLDLACPNFGVQEWCPINDATRACFPGTPTLRDGALWPGAGHGLGVGFKETLAADHPPSQAAPDWTIARAPDGAFRRP